MTFRGLCGTRQTNLQAKVKNYGTVWYDPGGWVNILSLHQVKEAHDIKFNSVTQDEFIVTGKLTGETADIFRPSPQGLYYTNWATTTTTNGSVLVSTVKENKVSYSKHDVKRAEAVRALQAKIGRPTTRELMAILDQKLITNCPYTSKDVQIAEKIFGPDIGSLKGKTVRSRPNKVHTDETKECAIPAEYRDVTLGMDVMHVNGVGFLVTVSRNIKFGTIDVISSTQDSEIIQSVKKVVSTYRRGGLRPKIILADGAFDTTEIKNALGLLGMKLNPTSREEHVGDIERYIRTIKERMRCVYNTLPFKFVPRIMVMELGKFAVYWLNSFPAKNGISERSSPRVLVTGEDIDFNKHCQYEFGQYVQVHEPHNNTMQARTVGAIALRPTGNKQGGYYFMSLVTGRVLNRSRATIVPMPEGIEKRVAALTSSQDQYPELAFGNRDNRVTMIDFEDLNYNEEEDEDYVVHEEYDEVLRYDDDFIAEELADVDVDDGDPVEEDIIADDESGSGGQDGGVMDGIEEEADNDLIDLEGPLIEENNGNEAPNPGADEENSINESVEVEDAHMEDNLAGGNMSTPAEATQSEDVLEHASEHEQEIAEQFVEQAVADNALNELDEVENAVQGISNEEMTEDPSGNPSRAPSATQNPTNSPSAGPSGDDASRVNPTRHQYNLRTNRERNYAYRYHGDIYVGSTTVQDLSTPKMSMKQGVRMFGDAGVSAVKTEVVQLHEREVIKAIQKSKLTKEQIREALGYLMFLKRKRTGKIKGRGCADGRKQRNYIAKEDATSPTVSTDAVFITAIIDAMEGRCVTVVDIPGAFMQVAMDKGVHMRITGLMATLLIEIDPSYKQFVVYEHGEPVIYVELLRALYGTLRAARLFWERLSEQIKEWGFEINPYDSCVANKVINGSQCTITWHIDDLKISHKEEQVVSGIVDDIKRTFGQLGEVSISEGKRHDYLGMYLDYSEPGVLIVDMRSYIQNALDDMPKQFKGKAATPAAQHLFAVNDHAPKMNKEKSEYFHSLVMQLMYLAHRGRPDIRVAIGFLSTRVASPDLDDWRKLSRVMKYLQATKDLLLRLECDGSGRVQWWIDASYAVHPDMRGHTGAVMTLGKGGAMNMSSKEKLVSRSSTESKLIGVHDGLPNLLWCRNFLIHQGYQPKDVVLYQDNLSAVQLEKNGRASSSKRTKHINVRYFYVKDRIAKKELRVEHCPTEDMLADFHTKPLQGHLFYKFRDAILNIPKSDKYHSSQRSVLEVANIGSATADNGQTKMNEEGAWQVVTRKKKGHRGSSSNESTKCSFYQQ